MPIIEHTTLPEFKCENKDSLHFNANTRTRRRTMQGCQRGNDHVRSSTWIAAVKGFEHQQSIAHEHGDRQTREALGTAVLATPSTRRIALQPASRKLALPRNTRGMEGATSHKQAAWQNVHTATRGRTGPTRATHSLDGDDILQADADTVKKVTINEPSISPTVDMTVKALPEGPWLGRQVPQNAHE